MSKMQRIAGVTIFLGLISPIPASATDCASKLNASSAVSSIIQCLKDQETEIATLKLKQGPKGDRGEQGATGPVGPAGKKGDPGDPAFVPAGVVVAFDSPNGCPRGWKEFEAARGRTILGANASRTHGYTARPFGNVGGEEEHLLTINEMPSHDHGGIWGGDGKKAGMNNSYAYHAQGYVRISSEGGGQPHNNMPPYIALYFCKKEG